MTITCENCNTRFVLDETRIPAQGARVRCSRCQHRFHVKPPPAQPSPEEIAERAVEHSAPFEPDGGREEPAEAAPRGEREGDGALDNPEFIFEPGASATTKAPSPVEEEPPDDPREQTFSRQRLQQPGQPTAEPGQPPPEPPPAALSAPAPTPDEASVFAPIGETQVSLSDDDPSGSTATGSREDLFGDAPDEGLAIANAEDTPTPDLAPPPSKSAAGIRGATGATLSPAGPILDVAPGPGARSMSSATVPAAPAAKPWRGFAREVVPAAEAEADAPKVQPRKRAEPDGAPRAWPGLLVSIATRAAACVVVAALVGGAARTLVLEVTRPEPLRLRGEGWLATDVDAFHARSSDGRRVLVIRGALVAEGPQPPPAVRALLLDAQGRPLGEPAIALAQRLDGADLAPAALAARLASGSVEAPAGPVRGFTVLVAEPPPGARRYQIELGPGS